jgi:hypothetical protein
MTTSMMPDDWREYIAAAERDIKKAPVPTKRHQPKVKRMTSSRMRIAESQTSNPVKAIFNGESKWNATPTMPEDWEGTKEVGPGDINNAATQWRTGNMTVEPSINGNKVQPRGHSHGAKKGTSENLDELLKEYDV